MNEIEQASKILRDGGVVIYPTDTAYAIGCRIDNEEAVKRIFGIRKRPENKPILVLADSIKMAQHYFLPLSEKVRSIAEKYWPGGLTIVYACDTTKVPRSVRAGGETLGIRVPDNPLTLSLIQKVGVPLLAPSANFSGEKTPFHYNEIDRDLLNLVDFSFKGSGTSTDVSTILDCSNHPYTIIRQGVVKLDINELQ